MKPSEIIAEICKPANLPANVRRPVELARVFRVLAGRLPESRTLDGRRVLDQSDFTHLLRELAEEAEK
jgi:hypothetical protein